MKCNSYYNMMSDFFFIVMLEINLKSENNLIGQWINY